MHGLFISLLNKAHVLQRNPLETNEFSYYLVFFFFDK